MLGLKSFRPDLKSHEAIVGVIEPEVKKYTVEELEELNLRHRQAGIPAYKHEEFLCTPHVWMLSSSGKHLADGNG